VKQLAAAASNLLYLVTVSISFFHVLIVNRVLVATINSVITVMRVNIQILQAEILLNI
jgi:hypothetical protein